jgi:hypothetical protein
MTILPIKYNYGPIFLLSISLLVPHASEIDMNLFATEIQLQLDPSCIFWLLVPPDIDTEMTVLVIEVPLLSHSTLTSQPAGTTWFKR